MVSCHARCVPVFLRKNFQMMTAMSIPISTMIMTIRTTLFFSTPEFRLLTTLRLRPSSASVSCSRDRVLSRVSRWVPRSVMTSSPIASDSRATCSDLNKRSKLFYASVHIGVTERRISLSSTLIPGTFVSVSSISKNCSLYFPAPKLSSKDSAMGKLSSFCIKKRGRDNDSPTGA